MYIYIHDIEILKGDVALDTEMPVELEYQGVPTKLETKHLKAQG